MHQCFTTCFLKLASPGSLQLYMCISQVAINFLLFYSLTDIGGNHGPQFRYIHQNTEKTLHLVFHITYYTVLTVYYSHFAMQIQCTLWLQLCFKKDHCKMISNIKKLNWFLSPIAASKKRSSPIVLYLICKSAYWLFSGSQVWCENVVKTLYKGGRELHLYWYTSLSILQPSLLRPPLIIRPLYLVPNFLSRLF